MRLTVRALGFTLTQALREHATHRLQLALGRFAPRLGHVHVRLSDVNGPKGGDDKRCHINVVVTGAREITVEELHADLYAAVDVAAERAAQAVSRTVHRTPRAA